MIESDRRGKKISRLETNYSPGIGEVKLSLGRLNQITGKGFTGSVIEGCDCMNYSWKLHTRGEGGGGGADFFVKRVIFESLTD